MCMIKFAEFAEFARYRGQVMEPCVLLCLTYEALNKKIKGGGWVNG